MLLGFWIILILLGSFTGIAAQLPPEIMADGYMLQADQRMEKKDPEGALEVLRKIVALQEEHNFTLPVGFHFKYARVAFSAGRIGAALESLNQYLVAAGRDGEFYRQALLLWGKAERIQPLLDQYRDSIEQLTAENNHGAAIALMDEILILQEEHDFTLPKGFHSKYAEIRIAGADPKCMVPTEEGECWMKLANYLECYVWFPRFSNVWRINSRVRSVTWTDGCFGGLAQGRGSLTWVDDRGEPLWETTGILQQGKGNGHWVEQAAFLAVWEGPYVEGKKHGIWDRSPGGNGPFVEDKRHGVWVEGSPGHQFKGPYVEDKRHGQWTVSGVGSESYGTDLVGGGPYVDGRKHGDWVEHETERKSEGPYAEGLRHGRWKITDYTQRYAYWTGENSGYAGPTNIEQGSYEAGKKTGIWKHEQLWYYVRTKCYEKAKQPYVDGKIHGESLFQNTNCDCYRNVYDRGNRVSYKKVRKNVCRRERN